MKRFVYLMLPFALVGCSLNADAAADSEVSLQPQVIQQASQPIDLPIAQVATQTPNPPTMAPQPTETPMPSPTLSELQVRASRLPVLREAPELHDGIWLNTDVPLRLADLRGQVVLLEMWTFDCINCIRTLPYVEQWHQTYSDQGLVVIGNHYPEFSYERDLANVRASLDRLEITYAILQDNSRRTWAAYNNRYWPTMYLIDKQGNIRYTHIGEGRYLETEEAIQALLSEQYTPDQDMVTSPLWSLTPTEALNVRSGPGTNYDRISLIMPNEAYYVLDEQNGWYKIAFDDLDAWVYGDYVTVNESEQSA